MPYFQAVIQEGLRMHPAAAFPLVRVVPKGGAQIAGKYFPEGVSSLLKPLRSLRPCLLIELQVTVGINCWVAHANKDVFGDDVDKFRPERWLVDKEKVSMMSRYWLPVSRFRLSYYSHPSFYLYSNKTCSSAMARELA